MARRLDGRDNIDGTIQLGPWTEGIVNSQSDKSIAGTAFRDALNVDIDDKGKVSRRKGYTKVYSCVNKLSKMIGMGQYIIHYEGGFLSVLDPVLGVSNVISMEYGKVGEDVCFLEVNDEIYFSSKRLSNSGIVYRDNSGSFKIRDFGVPVIPSDPMLSISSGSLKQGSYNVSFILENEFGEEGGGNVPTLITVPEGSSIVATITLDPRIVSKCYGNLKINTYISEQNGEVLYKYSSVPCTSAPQVITIDASSTKGAMLRTALINPFPFVGNLTYCNGRIYGSDGNIIFYSEPYRYGLVDFKENYLILSSECKLLCSVQDGIYIADKMTYYVSCENTAEIHNRRTVLPYSSVPGTECSMVNDDSVSWMSDKGIIIANDGGEVKNVQDPRFITNEFSGGAMVHRYTNGISQLIASLFEETNNEGVAHDFADAEIRRAGTF